MCIRHSWPRPPLLFGVAVLAALAVLLGRGVLPMQDSPALAVSNKSGGIHVLLGNGFPAPGVHQFSDGSTLDDVINLTQISGELALPAQAPSAKVALADGVALEIIETPAGIKAVATSWMPARQRLALGIALHPDRMDREDWVALPGIGEKLAREIESDRQKYGEFGRFEALERVKGLGPAKLRALKTYFVKVDN